MRVDGHCLLAADPRQDERDEKPRALAGQRIGGPESHFASRALIWAVRLYQSIAPPRLRCACRFDPSCSEYMILAVRKYGCWRGVGMGLRRLVNCRPPHGGTDYP